MYNNIMLDFYIVHEHALTFWEVLQYLLYISL